MNSAAGNRTDNGSGRAAGQLAPWAAARPGMSSDPRFRGGKMGDLDQTSLLITRGCSNSIALLELAGSSRAQCARPLPCIQPKANNIAEWSSLEVRLSLEVPLNWSPPTPAVRLSGK